MECLSRMWKVLVLLSGLGPLTATKKCTYPEEILGVEVESWDNIIRGSQFYLKRPSNTNSIESLDIPIQRNSENFGQRLRTYFLAPETGTYVFYIACDDSCKLSISTDWAQENLKTSIRIKTYTRYRGWKSENSNEVNLTKDHFYLLEVIWEQNRGYYHMSVGVGFPTGNYSLPVSKDFLAKYPPPVRPIEVRNTSSTSLLVKWKSECPVRWPNEHFTVAYYKEGDETTQNITVNTTNQSVEIRGLEVFTRYCVRIHLDTVAGVGQKPPCVSAMTDEDVRCRSPTGILARNYSSPTKIRVSWQALPDSCWKGTPRGYSIRLQVNKTAHKENETWNDQFFLVPWEPVDSLNPRKIFAFQIKSLQTYTAYSLQVAALTEKGIGQYSEALFVETCRCPKRFFVNWVQTPPLILKENDVDGTRPSGILPGLLRDMIIHTCGICHGHRRTEVVFREEKPSIHDITSSFSDRTQLNLPISMAPHIPFDRGEWEFLPVVEMAGIAVLMRKPSHGVYARYLGYAVFKRWPAVLIMFVLHCVFGLAVWTVEKYKNPAQFSPLFTRGWSQGIWCAIVTMTTVGYGDRYPISTPGRLLIVVSLLVGLIMDALFVSTMTTSLTVFVVEEAANPERGSKIGVVSASVEQSLGMRMNGSKGITTILYPTRDAVLQGLKSGALDGALMDVLTVDPFIRDLNDPSFEVAKIIPQKFHFGMILTGDARHLTKDFQNYLKSIPIESYSKQPQLAVQDKKAKSPQETKPTVSSEVEVIPFFDPRNVLFQRTLKVTGISLLAAVICGLVYYTLKERLKCEQDEPTDTRPNVAAVKAELKQLLDEFHNRMQRRYFALRIKHRKELLQFRGSAAVVLKSYRRKGAAIGENV